jgi:hypothetical protein
MKTLYPRTLLALVTVLGGFTFGGLTTQANIYNWTNSASGGWNTAANWNPNSVPNANDTAIITNAGVTVSLNGTTTVGAVILGNSGPGTVTLALAGQTLALNGPFTVNPSGSFTVDSGALVGNTNAILTGAMGWTAGSLGGVLTLASGSTLTLTSGSHNAQSLTLTNNGTVVWSAGVIQGGGNPGTTIVNNGLWNVQDDLTWNNVYSGFGTAFNNNSGGTLRKSGSSNVNGSTAFNAGFVINNTGKLDAQTNYLNFQGGGNLTGGTATNLNGIVYLYSGAFNINGTVTSTNVQLAGGTLTGNNVINGGLNWIIGDWNGSASETIASGSLLLITTTSAHNVQNCTITNNGTVAWSAGAIQAGGIPGTLIVNKGLWDCQSDQQINTAYGGNGTIFNNLGTFRKSGGAGIGPTYTLLAGGVLFNQLAGVVDVQNGTNGLELAFQGGGNFTGGYIATNVNSAVVLSVGNFTVNGTVTGTNTVENAGNLVGTNVINGALTWVDGVWNGTVTTILPNSTVIGIGSGVLDMNAAFVTNNGTFNWVSGQLRGGNGTMVQNNGLWNCQSDQQFNNAYGGTGTTFNNTGTFRKSGGAGIGPTYTLFAGSVLFNQLAGLIDCQNGTNGLELAFQGGGNFTGGYIATNVNSAVVLSFGSFTVNGTVTGTNTLENSGNLVGANVINGALTWSGGYWNGSYVTIATNSRVVIAGGGGNMDLQNTWVTNYGTVAWSTGTVRGGGGGLLGTQIQNYGLWDCQNDQTLNDAFGGNGTTFNNYGILRKTGGGPEFTNSTVFAGGVFLNQSAGVIDVQNSTNGLSLVFQGGGNLTGGYITTNQFGLTVLGSGNFTINGTVTGTNTWENNGNLINTNIIKGALTWIGGNWDGYYVTIATNSTLLIAGGGNNMDLQNTWVTNYGTVAWSSGTLRGGGGGLFGTLIQNYGIWNCQSDQVFNDAFGGNNTTINNYGSFRKTGTSGGSSQIQSGIFFNNPGVLDSQSGNISLQGTYSLTNGTLNTGINSLNNYGTISLAGAATLTGTISANLNNGYQPIKPNSFTNIYYGSFTGIFTNATLPFADAWTTNYFPTYFVLNVLNARPIFVAPTTNVFVVNELTTLAITNLATDADIPAQTLTYSLVAGTNGVVFNPTTGILTWTPQQTNSPSTNIFAVAVIDNGTPALSATNTLTVIVKEVNLPPVLGVIPTQTITLLQLFKITNAATEPNIHSTNAGYGLLLPPSGMTISSSGVISWTPAANQSLTTNTIVTVATNSNPYDLVNPHLTATNSFLVIVLPSTSATTLTSGLNGGKLTLTWPADHTGWELQGQTNILSKGLGTNWVLVPGSQSTNHIDIPIVSTNPAVFFRLTYP